VPFRVNRSVKGKGLDAIEIGAINAEAVEGVLLYSRDKYTEEQ